jgi:hypothetical protein
LWSLNGNQILEVFDEAAKKENWAPIAALIESAADLGQFLVNHMYSFFLRHNRPTKQPKCFDQLVNSGRHPTDYTLMSCVRVCDDRCIRIWPLDEKTILAALGGRLDAGTIQVGFTVAELTDLSRGFEFLLTHQQRPTWPQIVELIQQHETDYVGLALLIAIVQERYKESTMSTPTDENIEFMALHYFPKVASEAHVQTQLQLISSQVSDSPNGAQISNTFNND